MRHRFPVLRRNRFYTGKFDEDTGVKDVTWITPAGIEAAGGGLERRCAKCIGMMMDGRAQVHSVPQDGDHSTLLLVMNAHHEAIGFTLPVASDGHHWGLLFDTADLHDEEKRFEIGSVYAVHPRSLQLFVLDTHAPTPVPDETRAMESGD